MALRDRTEPKDGRVKFAWFWQLLLSAISGVLMAICLPPSGLWWCLCWVALVPVLFSLLIIPGNAGLVILQGVVFSAGFGLIEFHWLWKEHRYSEYGMILGVLALQCVIWSWFLWRFCKFPALPKNDKQKRNAGPEPVFLGAPGNAEAWRVSTAHLRLAALVASAWVFLEWGRGMILTAWNPLGLAVAANLPLFQLVKITGPAGPSFMVVFANVILLAAARRLALQPGRLTWAARFDVVFTLGIFFVIAVAGFYFGQPTPQPLRLRICATASPGSSVEELTSVLPAVATLKTDLLIWRKVVATTSGLKGFDRASVAPDVGVITGVARANDSPITGYSVFLPGSVKSVFSFAQDQQVFQLFADPRSKTLQSFMVRDVAFVPYVNHEGMSFQALKAGLRAPAQAFIALLDSPQGSAIEEKQFSENARCWALSLGRPIIIESRRAGAVLATSSGRALADISPQTKQLAAPYLDFPLANDMTIYASFGDWLPIVAGALCLFFGIRERLSNFYASPRRFST